MTVKEICEALGVSTRVTVKPVSKIFPMTDFYSNTIASIDESIQEKEVVRIRFEVAQVEVVRLILIIESGDTEPPQEEGSPGES